MVVRRVSVVREKWIGKWHLIAKFIVGLPALLH